MTSSPTPPLSSCCQAKIWTGYIADRCDRCGQPCDPATPEQPGGLRIISELQTRIAEFHANPSESGIDWLPVGVTELDALLRHIAAQDAKLATQDQWMREAREALAKCRDNCNDAHAVFEIASAVSARLPQPPDA